MSDYPKAEVNFNMRITCGTRPEGESDRDWSIRIVASIIPQMIGRITYHLTTDAELGGRRDGKAMDHEAVADSLCAVLCENLCSTWFMAGGSKKHLLTVIDEMYSAFEAEMLNTIEEQSPDGDIPIPNVTGVGHA